MTIKDEYRIIHDLWNKGIQYGDLHPLIVDWISKYKTIIRAKSLPHLISRLYTDEMKMVVNDFIFGEMYLDLRDEMK